MPREKGSHSVYGCGGCLLLVVALPVVVAAIAVGNASRDLPPRAAPVVHATADAPDKWNPVVEDDGWSSSSPPAFRAGETVWLVNDRGSRVVSIKVHGEFLRLANPSRLRIIDGRALVRRGAGPSCTVEVLDGEHAGARGVAAFTALRRSPR